ncbi:MAG: efflux transporter outer membrane subunit [Mitsuaria chitosanitabida]|uniref:efflux transporter outer membrane subunit n=1 Tax=Roseateles chitosanitabidus TaxID=65048 RepID=UPI001B161793|nr:efflux transporter outer membrane subunit [Roseateles chitosanitabidus]MBO9685822.1 efflux transporter outer membrane subunit [Roseateles chitosanitabidus]
MRWGTPRLAVPVRAPSPGISVAIGLLGGALLAGCAPALRAPPEAARPELPAGWREQPVSSASTASAPAVDADARERIRPDWWQDFGDPVLSGLVLRALDRNNDLLLAGARLDEARATLAASRAAEGPQLNATLVAQGSRTLQVTGISESHIVQPGLSASWELDLWDRLTALTRAARLRVAASEADRDGAALSVAATTVQSYIALLALESQLALSKATLDSRAEALRLAQDQARIGYISQLQLTQAQAEYASVAQQVPQLELTIRRQENALAQLTGQSPGDMPRGRRFEELDLPAPPVVLPSALLERRPDLAQASLTLAASDATLAARRAAFMPQISFSATGGKLYVAALDYNPLRVWSIGGSVLAPIFDAGRLQAQFDTATAQRDQAAYAYRGRVLTAITEVENALAGIERLDRQRRFAQERREVLARSLQYAHDRYDAGYASYLEELDAQRNLFAQDNDLIRIRQGELENRLALIRALGGGWRDTTVPVAPAAASPTTSAPAPSTSP